MQTAKTLRRCLSKALASVLAASLLLSGPWGSVLAAWASTAQDSYIDGVDRTFVQMLRDQPQRASDLRIYELMLMMRQTYRNGNPDVQAQLARNGANVTNADMDRVIGAMRDESRYPVLADNAQPTSEQTQAILNFLGRQLRLWDPDDPTSNVPSFIALNGQLTPQGRHLYNHFRELALRAMMQPSDTPQQQAQNPYYGELRTQIQSHQQTLDNLASSGPNTPERMEAARLQWDSISRTFVSLQRFNNENLVGNRNGEMDAMRANAALFALYAGLASQRIDTASLFRTPNFQGGFDFRDRQGYRIFSTNANGVIIFNQGIARAQAQMNRADLAPEDRMGPDPDRSEHNPYAGLHAGNAELALLDPNQARPNPDDPEHPLSFPLQSLADVPVTGRANWQMYYRTYSQMWRQLYLSGRGIDWRYRRLLVEMLSSTIDPNEQVPTDEYLRKHPEVFERWLHENAKTDKGVRWIEEFRNRPHMREMRTAIDNAATALRQYRQAISALRNVDVVDQQTIAQLDRYARAFTNALALAQNQASWMALHNQITRIGLSENRDANADVGVAVNVLDQDDPEFRPWRENIHNFEFGGTLTVGTFISDIQFRMLRDAGVDIQRDEHGRVTGHDVRLDSAEQRRRFIAQRSDLAVRIQRAFLALLEIEIHLRNVDPATGQTVDVQPVMLALNQEMQRIGLDLSLYSASVHNARQTFENSMTFAEAVKNSWEGIKGTFQNFASFLWADNPVSQAVGGWVGERTGLGPPRSFQADPVPAANFGPSFGRFFFGPLLQNGLLRSVENLLNSNWLAPIEGLLRSNWLAPVESLVNFVWSGNPVSQWIGGHIGGWTGLGPPREVSFGVSARPSELPTIWGGSPMPPWNVSGRPSELWGGERWGPWADTRPVESAVNAVWSGNPVSRWVGGYIGSWTGLGPPREMGSWQETGNRYMAARDHIDAYAYIYRDVVNWIAHGDFDGARALLMRSNPLAIFFQEKIPLYGVGHFPDQGPSAHLGAVLDHTARMLGDVVTFNHWSEIAANIIVWSAFAAVTVPLLVPVLNATAAVLRWVTAVIEATELIKFILTPVTLLVRGMAFLAEQTAMRLTTLNPAVWERQTPIYWFSSKWIGGTVQGMVHRFVNTAKRLLGFAVMSYGIGMAFGVVSYYDWFGFIGDEGKALLHTLGLVKERGIPWKGPARQHFHSAWDAAFKTALQQAHWASSSWRPLLMFSGLPTTVYDKTMIAPLANQVARSGPFGMISAGVQKWLLWMRPWQFGLGRPWLSTHSLAAGLSRLSIQNWTNLMVTAQSWAGRLAQGALYRVVLPIAGFTLGTADQMLKYIIIGHGSGMIAEWYTYHFNSKDTDTPEKRLMRANQAKNEWMEAPLWLLLPHPAAGKTTIQHEYMANAQGGRDYIQAYYRYRGSDPVRARSFLLELVQAGESGELKMIKDFNPGFMYRVFNGKPDAQAYAMFKPSAEVRLEAMRLLLRHRLQERANNGNYLGSNSPNLADYLWMLREVREATSPTNPRPEWRRTGIPVNDDLDVASRELFERYLMGREGRSNSWLGWMADWVPFGSFLRRLPDWPGLRTIRNLGWNRGWGLNGDALRSVDMILREGNIGKILDARTGKVYSIEQLPDGTRRLTIEGKPGETIEMKPGEQNPNLIPIERNLVTEIGGTLQTLYTKGYYIPGWIINRVRAHQDIKPLYESEAAELKAGQVLLEKLAEMEKWVDGDGQAIRSSELRRLWERMVERARQVRDAKDTRTGPDAKRTWTDLLREYEGMYETAKGRLRPVERDAMSAFLELLRKKEARFNALNSTKSFERTVLGDLDGLIARHILEGYEPAAGAREVWLARLEGLRRIRRDVEAFTRGRGDKDPVAGAKDFEKLLDSKGELMKHLESDAAGLGGKGALERHSVLREAFDFVENGPYLLRDRGKKIPGFREAQFYAIMEWMKAMFLSGTKSALSGVETAFRIAVMLKTSGGKTILTYEGFLPIAHTYARRNGMRVIFRTVQENLATQARETWRDMRRMLTDVEIGTYDKLKAKEVESNLTGNRVAHRELSFGDEIDAAETQAQTSIGEQTARIPKEYAIRRTLQERNRELNAALDEGTKLSYNRWMKHIETMRDMLDRAPRGYREAAEPYLRELERGLDRWREANAEPGKVSRDGRNLLEQAQDAVRTAARNLEEYLGGLRSLADGPATGGLRLLSEVEAVNKPLRELLTGRGGSRASLTELLDQVRQRRKAAEAADRSWRGTRVRAKGELEPGEETLSAAEQQRLIESRSDLTEAERQLPPEQQRDLLAERLKEKLQANRAGGKTALDPLAEAELGVDFEAALAILKDAQQAISRGSRRAAGGVDARQVRDIHDAIDAVRTRDVKLLRDLTEVGKLLEAVIQSARFTSGAPEALSTLKAIEAALDRLAKVSDPGANLGLTGEALGRVIGEVRQAVRLHREFAESFAQLIQKAKSGGSMPELQAQAQEVRAKLAELERAKPPADARTFQEFRNLLDSLEGGNRAASHLTTLQESFNKLLGIGKSGWQLPSGLNRLDAIGKFLRVRRAELAHSLVEQLEAVVTRFERLAKEIRLASPSTEVQGILEQAMSLARGIRSEVIDPRSVQSHAPGRAAAKLRFAVWETRYGLKNIPIPPQELRASLQRLAEQFRQEAAAEAQARGETPRAKSLREWAEKMRQAADRIGDAAQWSSLRPSWLGGISQRASLKQLRLGIRELAASRLEAAGERSLAGQVRRSSLARLGETLDSVSGEVSARVTLTGRVRQVLEEWAKRYRADRLEDRAAAVERLIESGWEGQEPGVLRQAARLLRESEFAPENVFRKELLSWAEQESKAGRPKSAAAIRRLVEKGEIDSDWDQIRQAETGSTDGGLIKEATKKVGAAGIRELGQIVDIQELINAEQTLATRLDKSAREVLSRWADAEAKAGRADSARAIRRLAQTGEVDPAWQLLRAREGQPPGEGLLKEAASKLAEEARVLHGKGGQEVKVQRLTSFADQLSSLAEGRQVRLGEGSQRLLRETAEQHRRTAAEQEASAQKIGRAIEALRDPDAFKTELGPDKYREFKAMTPEQRDAKIKQLTSRQRDYQLQAERLRALADGLDGVAAGGKASRAVLQEAARVLREKGGEVLSSDSRSYKEDVGAFERAADLQEGLLELARLDARGRLEAINVRILAEVGSGGLLGGLWRLATWRRLAPGWEQRLKPLIAERPGLIDRATLGDQPVWEAYKRAVDATEQHPLGLYGLHAFNEYFHGKGSGEAFELYAQRLRMAPEQAAKALERLAEAAQKQGHATFADSLRQTAKGLRELLSHAAPEASPALQGKYQELIKAQGQRDMLQQLNLRSEAAKAQKEVARIEREIADLERAEAQLRAKDLAALPDLLKESLRNIGSWGRFGEYLELRIRSQRMMDMYRQANERAGKAREAGKSAQAAEALREAEVWRSRMEEADTLLLNRNGNGRFKEGLEGQFVRRALEAVRAHAIDGKAPSQLRDLTRAASREMAEQTRLATTNPWQAAKEYDAFLNTYSIRFAWEQMRALSKDRFLSKNAEDQIFWTALGSLVRESVSWIAFKLLGGNWGIGGAMRWFVGRWLLTPEGNWFGIPWMNVWFMKWTHGNPFKGLMRPTSLIKEELTNLANGQLEDPGTITVDRRTGQVVPVHNGQYSPTMDTPSRRYWEVKYKTDLTLPYTHKGAVSTDAIFGQPEQRFVSFTGTLMPRLRAHMRAQGTLIVGEGSKVPPGMRQRTVVDFKETIKQVEEALRKAQDVRNEMLDKGEWHPEHGEGSLVVVALPESKALMRMFRDLVRRGVLEADQIAKVWADVEYLRSQRPEAMVARQMNLNGLVNGRVRLLLLDARVGGRGLDLDFLGKGSKGKFSGYRYYDMFITNPHNIPEVNVIQAAGRIDLGRTQKLPSLLPERHFTLLTEISDAMQKAPFMRLLRTDPLFAELRTQPGVLAEAARMGRTIPTWEDIHRWITNDINAAAAAPFLPRYEQAIQRAQASGQDTAGTEMLQSSGMKLQGGGVSPHGRPAPALP